jgi:hypothetical protein
MNRVVIASEAKQSCCTKRNRIYATRLLRFARNDVFFAVFFLIFSFPAFSMMGRTGDMVGSGGFGITVAPTLVLLSPELEYVYNPDLNFGGLVQMGFGDAFLFTASGKARWSINYHPQFHPTFETGLGLAVGSNYFTSSAGVHIMFGGGVDYVLNRDTSIGTMMRLNFAPPLKGVFISWPMIIGRFRL